MPGWACDWLEDPARFKVAYGGRASGKTWAIAHILILQASQHSLRVVCAREFQNSLDFSSKAALERAVHDFGLGRIWRIGARDLRCTRTGSHITFHGLERNRESLRGLDGVNRWWIEEGQNLSHESAEVWLPTVREPGAQIFVSFNPRHRQDWVWDQFVVKRRGEAEGDLRLEKVNFERNRWLDDGVKREEQRFKILEPDRHAHVWLGELDDDDVRKVLSWEQVETCREAWRRGLHKPQVRPVRGTWVEAGLDLAVTGWSALSVRRGPVVEHVTRWRGKLGSDLRLARRAARVCEAFGVERLHVDAGGVGSGVYSHLREIRRNFSVHAEQFGAGVKGPEEEVYFGRTNADYFGRRNAQLGWNLRLRARMTQLLMEGKAVDRTRCLFLHDDLPDWPGLHKELSQPEWEESGVTGKIEVEKSPDELPSPDRYDATVRAFAAATAFGIRRFDWKVL